MRFVPVVVAILSIMLPTLKAEARTWIVDPSGTGDATTVQEGVNLAIEGDTVCVSCGLYWEHDVVVRSGIVLRTETGDPSCATIDAGGNARVFHCEDLDSTTTIEGFTIQGAQGGFLGGGMYCVDSSPLILSCTFRDNWCSYGGGIYCAGGSHPRLEECAFIDNEVGLGPGGGICCYNPSAPLLINCLFDGNQAPLLSGGAIFAYGGLTLQECVFINNSAYFGGAIDCPGTPEVSGCLFAGNTATLMGGAIYTGGSGSVWGSTFSGNGAPSGGSIYVNIAGNLYVENSIVAFASMGAGIWCERSASDTGEVAITCSNVFGNAAGDWVGCIENQQGVAGNFSADPLFCDETSNFTLDAASPCLSAPGCGLIGAYGQGCDVLTEVASEDTDKLDRFLLYQNTPNPFNPTTAIRFFLPGAGPVNVSVYDVAGREVARLVEGNLAPGDHAIVWNGKDFSGDELPSGLYFARLLAGSLTATRKIALIR